MTNENKYNFMVILICLTCVILPIGIVAFVASCQKEEFATVTGTVIAHERDPATHGYRSYHDAEYYIILSLDSGAIYKLPVSFDIWYKFQNNSRVQTRLSTGLFHYEWPWERKTQ